MRQPRQIAAIRKLRFERLEARSLLAIDLGTIGGTVSRGAAVSGAMIRLYQDDGDGVFESADDDLLTTVQSAADGKYAFDRLLAGAYWVEQPSQTAGPTTLGYFLSPLITISEDEARGLPGILIDEFANTVLQAVQANSVGVPGADATDDAGVLGGERDLLVELLAGIGGQSATLSSQGGLLEFDTTIDATGRFISTYDGDDDDALVVNGDGLGNIDLTSGGLSDSVLARLLADAVGASARIRIYSDSVSFSDSPPIAIPADGSQFDAIFAFADFTQAVGASAVADFTSVDAISLIIETDANGVSGHAALLQAFGPTIKTLDITNNANLSLQKTVDQADTAVGENVVFTLTLTNAGPAGATNIRVVDTIPAGISFLSANPDLGTFNQNTSSWEILELAPGASATLQITASIDEVGPQINSAELVASDQPDPNSTPNNGIAEEDDQDAVTVTARQIDLSLAMTVTDNTPNRNQEITFEITVTNAGPDSATGVSVLDLLPDGLIFVSSEAGQGAYSEETGIWTVGTLASGADATLEIVARTTSGGNKQNVAEVAAADQPDLDSTPNNQVATEDDRASVLIIPNVANLSLTQSVDDATPDKNQLLTFSIVVTNSGPAAATGVVATDLLPAGLSFSSATATVGAYDNITGLWTIGALASGATATLEIKATTVSADAKTNLAEVTAAEQFDPNSSPNNHLPAEDDQASVTVTPNVADLVLTQNVNIAAPTKNQKVIFTITIANGGSASATGITVSDSLPAGMGFVSATATQGAYNSASGIWTVGTLASGATATLQIEALPTLPGTKTNIAQVSAANQFDPNSTPGNNLATENDQASAVVTPPVADLSLVKTVNNLTPSVGQNVVFTLTLTNSGPNAATNVVVADALPTGLAIISASPSLGDYIASTGLWQVGPLNSGQTATLQITAKVNIPGNITSIASVNASDQFDLDSTPGNSLAEDDMSSVTLISTVAPLPTTFSKRLFLARTPR